VPMTFVTAVTKALAVRVRTARSLGGFCEESRAVTPRFSPPPALSYSTCFQRSLRRHQICRLCPRRKSTNYGSSPPTSERLSRRPVQTRRSWPRYVRESSAGGGCRGQELCGYARTRERFARISAWNAYDRRPRRVKAKTRTPTRISNQDTTKGSNENTADMNGEKSCRYLRLAHRTSASRRRHN